MSMVWKLQDAKNKFSELVEKSQSQGPQEITKHGKKAAVLLSFQDYKKLNKKQESLIEFFRHSPLNDLDLKRTVDYPRKLPL